MHDGICSHFLFIQAVMVSSAICFLDNFSQTIIVSFLPVATTKYHHHVHGVPMVLIQFNHVSPYFFRYLPSYACMLQSDTMYSIGVMFAMHSLFYLIGSFLCRHLG